MERWRRAAFVPAIAALAELAWEVLSGEGPFPFLGALTLLLYLTPLVLLERSRHRKRIPDRELQHWAVLSPCLLAPLATVYPWAVVPSRVPGIAYGGPRFFLHWLTKYPSLGPINHEVLL